MKERPILCNSEMVRAILRKENPKTQTRRVVKAKDSDPSRCITMDMLLKNIQEWRFQDGRWFGIDGYDTLVFADCPFGQVGDRLWVKETWGVGKPMDSKPISRMLRKPQSIWYAADGKPEWAGKTRSSRFMRRWASRITLEITGVRVERLNEISEEDAISEGVVFGTGLPGECRTCAKGAYMDLWNKIYGADSWLKNPWVWVVEFKRIAP